MVTALRPRTLGIFALFVAAGCGSPRGAATPAPAPTSEPAAEAPRTDGGQAELAAFERVAPVFAQHCKACHASGTRLSSDEAMREVNMESYPFGGAPPREMGRKIRLSVGLDGKKRTMPPESWHFLPPDDLALIAEWVASLQAAH